MDANGVCTKCFSGLTFVCEPFCHKCGRPLDKIAKEWNFCPFCATARKTYFDKARFALLYDENSAPLILALKYADKTEVVPMMARWINGAAKDIKADIVTPVPLHNFRMLQRKYNQAAMLAKKMAQLRKVKYEILLKRTKNTGTQGNLSPNMRKKNVKNAFSICEKCDIKGKKIIIVDDVMTTGATLNECAKTLKKAGAKEVYVVALAVVLK